MYVSDVYDKELLILIQREQSLTLDELRRLYLPPQSENIITSKEASFETDIKTLAKFGMITYYEKTGIITFIHD